MKLVIVSHVRHYQSAGHLHAYAPYAREVEVWADLFDEVVIAAPLCTAGPVGDCGAIRRSNVQIAPQRELGGEGRAAKLKLAWNLPAMAWDLCRALRQGDAIHVRCPGNLGFLGAILAPFFSNNLVAKFAGQWNSNPTDPLSVRFQRALLRSRWWRGPVTVCGNWPDLPPHVVPFFSSAVTAEEVTRATLSVQERTPDEAKHILFVGRLSKSKNVDILLRAVARLRFERFCCTCTIVGDGPERAALQALSSSLGVNDSVEFTGGVPFNRVLELYARSGILVLVSQSEGWPKAIAEGMAFGLVAIGSNLGWIPEMLAEGRGFVVPPRNVEALASTLREILNNPGEHAAMRERAAAWSQNYSLDGLRESLGALLAKSWGMRIHTESKSPCSASVECVHE